MTLEEAGLRGEYRGCMVTTIHRLSEINPDDCYAIISWDIFHEIHVELDPELTPDERTAVEQFAKEWEAKVNA